MAATWETPPDEPTRGRRRTGLMVIAAVLVLVIVIAVALALEGHRKSSAGTPGPVVTTTTAAPPASITTPASVVPTSPAVTPTATSVKAPLSSAVPTAAPNGVTWSLFQGVALPSSVVDGPTHISGSVLAGFSRTPDGALLALAQISSRYLITPGTGWRDVTNAQVLPSSGRDKFVAARAAVTSTGGDTFGQTAGFKFVTYTPDAAVIELVSRFPSYFQVVTGTVRWSGNDWRLELQPDGGISPSAQQVQSLTGFIPWSGVS
ncbi:hypothetical protein acdb102_21650 [Acidothermaceae bacterium B102]|nr:hypothetical protein acdb102_21650 [Acidothermaceae bacterium B102]